VHWTAADLTRSALTRLPFPRVLHPIGTTFRASVPAGREQGGDIRQERGVGRQPRDVCQLPRPSHRSWRQDREMAVGVPCRHREGGHPVRFGDRRHEAVELCQVRALGIDLLQTDHVRAQEAQQLVLSAPRRQR
jgi:hypothetical protein